MPGYSKQTWTDNDPTTPINAARLGHIEDGIAGRDLFAIRTVTANDSPTSADDLLLLNPTGLPRPLSRSVTAVGSGGTFAADTYQWQITAIDGSGHESRPTIGVAATLVLNGSAQLTWSAVPGATGYKIYRSTFDFGNAMANPPGLVTTLGAVTSYTDTGAAANSSVHPPADNGAAFTVTLPTAVGARPLRLKAIGATPNLVTVVPQAGETVDGGASIAVGITYLADWSEVVLIPDGVSGWRSIGGEKSRLQRKVFANVYPVVCAAGVVTPVVVVPCPPLIPDVTKMIWHWSMNATPNSTDVTNLTPSINRSASDGTYLGNMAYWNDKAVTNGEARLLSAQWDYAPRPGDPDLEDGAGKYLGLFLTSSGGQSTAIAGFLEIVWGSFEHGGWPSL